MRVIIVVAVLALAACSPRGDAVRRMAVEDTCGAEKLRLLVGLPFEPRDFDAGDTPLRILPPGSVVTMDHRPERLNVDLDDEDVVIRIWCG